MNALFISSVFSFALNDRFVLTIFTDENVKENQT